MTARGWFYFAAAGLSAVVLAATDFVGAVITFAVCAVIIQRAVDKEEG